MNFVSEFSVLCNDGAPQAHDVRESGCSHQGIRQISSKYSAQNLICERAHGLGLSGGGNPNNNGVDGLGPLETKPKRVGGLLSIVSNNLTNEIETPKHASKRVRRRIRPKLCNVIKGFGVGNSDNPLNKVWVCNVSNPVKQGPGGVMREPVRHSGVVRSLHPIKVG
jgi:hypothetical protein